MFDEKSVEELADELDIELENVVHVTLVGSVEMMGELFPEKGPKGKDLIFLHPIRIVKDTWIDQDGEYGCQSFFLEWNALTEGPYAPINPQTIISKKQPTQAALMGYLRAIHSQYFPLEAPEIDDELQEEVIKAFGNVIEFSKYKKK